MLAVLLAAGCGPRPGVLGFEAEPPARPGDPYRVLVSVVNLGAAGDVALEARLRDLADGRTYLGSERLRLEGDESAVVPLALDAPAGRYRVEIRAFYPVD